MSEPERDPEQPDGLALTPVRALVIAAILGGFAGWLIVITPRALDRDVPQVTWPAPIGLMILAVLVIVLARTTYLRIQRRRERIDPRNAVTLLALGKAAALAGALIAGGYLVFGLQFVGSLAAPLPRERVIRSGVAVVAAVALCIGGLLLERACRIPEDEQEKRRRRRRARG